MKTVNRDQGSGKDRRRETGEDRDQERRRTGKGKGLLLKSVGFTEKTNESER